MKVGKKDSKRKIFTMPLLYTYDNFHKFVTALMYANAPD